MIDDAEVRAYAAVALEACQDEEVVVIAALTGDVACVPFADLPPSVRNSAASWGVEPELFPMRWVIVLSYDGESVTRVQRFEAHAEHGRTVSVIP